MHLALYGLAVALPLLGALIFLFVDTARRERAELDARVQQALVNLVQTLDRDLERQLTVLRALATSPHIQHQNWPAFYDQAKSALEGQTYLVLVDTTGRQVVNTFVPFGEQPETTGDMETVRRMQAAPGPVFSNLFVSKVARQPVLNASIPVIKDGRLSYVMSLGLLPADLARLMEGQSLGQDWVSTIMDAEGTIIARSRDNLRFLGTKVPERLRAHPGGPFRTTGLTGEDVLRAVTRSELSGWEIATNFAYGAVERQILAGLWLTGGAIAAGLAIAIVLAVLLGRSITLPLAQTAQAATALGQGQRVSVGRSSLSEANAIAEALEKAGGELEQRRAELLENQQHLAAVADTKTVLLNELNHRVKNSLATVQALALVTFAKEQSPTVEVFNARLRALASAHDVLTRESWQTAELRDIVAEAIKPFDGGHRPFAIEGPDVRLPPRAALGLGLVLHELCTNAAKYGALSTLQGGVSVNWSVAGDGETRRLKLMWRERGGPEVRAPAQQGFGSQLIQGILANDLGATLAIDYAPGGVSYAIEAPIEAPAEE